MYMLISAVVAILGMLIYAFSGAKPAEIGRIMFACGLLVFLFLLRSDTVRLP